MYRLCPVNVLLELDALHVCVIDKAVAAVKSHVTAAGAVIPADVIAAMAGAPVALPTVGATAP